MPGCCSPWTLLSIMTTVLYLHSLPITTLNAFATPFPKTINTCIFSQPDTESSSQTTQTNTAEKRSNTKLPGFRLIESLVQDQKCFSCMDGAKKFLDNCADTIVFDDRALKEPASGIAEVKDYLEQKVKQRQGRGSVRIDKLSDGTIACGFTWTWISGQEEGLRGTTFVQLDTNGSIQKITEIPEPLYKPGDLTKALLEAVTKGSEWYEFQPFVSKEPKSASELAKYLYLDLQMVERTKGTDELERFWDPNIVYQDFNYKEPFVGPKRVRKLVEDFTFPGIEFRPVCFDDGINSTCFLWNVVLKNADETITGISFLELDPESRKVVYIRDIPEPTFKPPAFGWLARKIRPGLGVFRGVPLGSRPGGVTLKTEAEG